MVTFSLWRPFHSFITFVPATGFSVPYTPLDLRSLLKQFSPTNSPPQTSKPFGAQFRPHVLRSASSDSPTSSTPLSPIVCLKWIVYYVFVWSFDWCLPSLPDRKLHPFCSPLYLKHWLCLEAHGRILVSIYWSSEGIRKKLWLSSSVLSDAQKHSKCGAALPENFVVPKMNGKLENASEREWEWERLSI